MTVAEAEPPRRSAARGTSSALAVYFDRRAGQTTVTGGLLVSALFVLAAVIGELWVLVVGVPIGLLVSVHHLAMLTNIPQLVLSERGLYVDGIGLLGWDAIAEVQMVRKNVRTLDDTQIYMLFEGPVRDAILAPAFAGHWRRLQIMAWDAPDPDLLTLRLAPLDVDAETLMDTLERFWMDAYGRRTGKGTGPGPSPGNPRDAA